MTVYGKVLSQRLDGWDRTIGLSHRERSSEAATLLRRLRIHFPSLGITRLGEITQLDVTGVPVAFACRPNSFSLSISLGKGLTRSMALISAAMEAAETAVAEREPPNLVTATENSLRESGHAVIDLTRVARCWPHLTNAAAPSRWLDGVDLLSGASVSVPWDLVKLDHRIEPGEEIGAFEISTDGLASARTAAEATLHALYELIERDALALFETGFKPESAPSVHLVRECGNRRLDALLENLRRANHDLYLVDITTDIGIPTWLAMVAETPGGAPATAKAIHFIGCACHANDHTAALSASLEAVQARCAYIAGARDDFAPANDRDIDPEEPATPLLNWIRQAPKSPLPHVWKPRPPATSVGEQIGDLLERMAAKGVRQVVAVELPCESLGISVARIIATDLQIPLHGSRTQLLGRGLRQALRLAR